MQTNGLRHDVDITYTTLYATDDLFIGRVRVPADSALWGRECLTPAWPGMSFPRRPVQFGSASGGSVVNSNHVVFFRREAEYRRRRVGGFGELSDVIWFAPHLIAQILEEDEPGTFDGPGGVFMPQGPCDATLRRAQLRLFEYADKSSAPDPILIEEAGAAMLAHAVHRARRVRGFRPRGRKPITDRRHREAVSNAVEFIGESMDRALSLAEIANVAGLTRFHFCRVFREVLGCAVHEYVRELRLQTALQLAPRYSGRTVDLALEVGFSSRSHLSNSFTRWFGQPLSSAFAGDADAAERALRRLLESMEHGTRN